MTFCLRNLNHRESASHGCYGSSKNASAILCNWVYASSGPVHKWCINETVSSSEKNRCQCPLPIAPVLIFPLLHQQRGRQKHARIRVLSSFIILSLLVKNLVLSGFPRKASASFYGMQSCSDGKLWKWEFTQFDFSIQREKNVSSFQISVDDLVLVKVDQGLQGLPAHCSDLRLGQWPLQFWSINTENSLKKTNTPTPSSLYLLLLW